MASDGFMVLGFLLFWMVYSPRLGTFGDVTSMASLLLLFMAVSKGAIEPHPVRQIRILLLVLFTGLFVYSLVLFMVNTPRELIFILRFMRIIIQFVGVYSLMRLYYCKYGIEMADYFIKHLFWVIVANAALMLLMFLFAPVREFVWDAIQLEEDRRRAKRIGGLTGALDTLSVIQAFALIIIPYLIHKYKGMKLLRYSASITLVMFSIIISGRTGLLLLILFLPMIAIFTKVKISRVLLIAGSSGLLMQLVLVFVNPNRDVQERFSGQVDRLKYLITSREQGGAGLQEGATAKLLEDFRNDWPETATQFVFGNSRSGRTDDNRIPADPGYILDVHGIGLTGLWGVSMFYLICLRQAFKCYRYNKFIASISFVYTLEVILVNAKVLFFLARTGLTISVAFLLLTVYYRAFYEVRSAQSARFGANTSSSQRGQRGVGELRPRKIGIEAKGILPS